jgi:hypothetical protein
MIRSENCPIRSSYRPGRERLVSDVFSLRTTERMGAARSCSGGREVIMVLVLFRQVAESSVTLTSRIVHCS